MRVIKKMLPGLPIAAATVMAAALLLAVTACKTNETPDAAHSKQEDAVEAKQAGAAKSETESITADIIAKFEKLAQIPHPSKHEEKICDYLENWAKERGLATIRDEKNNLVIDVPATKGMEGKPLAALQGHVDMVFAQGAERKLDPLTASITTINDGKTLSAEGTSLGADDGIGVSLALAVAEGKMTHGPLRIFFTTSEESAPMGASYLDPALVKEVRYLINVDSEDEGRVTVSSAAGTACRFSGEADAQPPAGNTALKISLSGLNGGHSGTDIHLGRLNAVIATGNAMKALKEHGTAFSLAKFTGGTAGNAIPASAEAVICVAENDREKAVELMAKEFNSLLKAHKKSDPKGTFAIKPAIMPESVMKAELKDALINLVCEIPNGVMAMSPDMEGLVQTSSNLGVINADGGQFKAESFARSSDANDMKEIYQRMEKLAGENGIQCAMEESTAPWKYAPDSQLLKITKETYRSLFHKDIIVETTHAGLECGIFANYNPEMEIISIGPTIQYPHSVNEVCAIESIDKIWMLIEGILAAI